MFVMVLMLVVEFGSTVVVMAITVVVERMMRWGGRETQIRLQSTGWRD